MFTTAFLDIPALQSANGEVQLPGSKSISNRVLLLAALSQGTTTIHDLLDSDDTQVMLKALEQLGCAAAYNLDGGQSADITLVPERPGTYPLRCTHFMHSAFGMRGSITVQ